MDSFSEDKYRTWWHKGTVESKRKEKMGDNELSTVLELPITGVGVPGLKAKHVSQVLHFSFLWVIALELCKIL